MPSAHSRIKYRNGGVLPKPRSANQLAEARQQVADLTEARWRQADEIIRLREENEHLLRLRFAIALSS